MDPQAGGKILDPARVRPLLLPAAWEQLQQTATMNGQEPVFQADELVRGGWLTPFQAQEILHGRGDQLLIDSYVILERLGAGGMGQVFKARHQLMDRLVALKVVKPDRLVRPKYHERFKREIQAAAKLAHPNIVTAFDAVEAGEQFVLIMEYIEGTDLARLVRQCGPLPVPLACDLVRQVALGLHHAHERGILHRDVKPSNILLSADGQVAKLVDLGLAIFYEAPEGQALAEMLTPTGAVMGTPDFLAPEQARNEHKGDARSDIYSLGCTLYALLAGHVPFPGGSATEKLLRHQMDEPPPLASRRPETPPDLAALVHKLMARSPQDRPQSAAEVAFALEPFCRAPVPAAPSSAPTSTGQQPVTVTQGSTTVVDKKAPSGPSATKRSRGRWLLASLTLCALAGIGWLVVEMSRENKPDGPVTPVGPGPGPPDPPKHVTGLLHTLKGHPDVITAVAFAPSGKVLFSGGSDGVRMWCWQTEQEIKHLAEDLSDVRALAVAGPSNRLLAGTQHPHNRLSLWDPAQGRRLLALTGPDRPIPIVAFAPAGNLSLAASDQRIHLHELGDGRERPFIEVPNAYLRAAAFTIDGKTVVAALRDLQRARGEGLEVYWWNADTGKRERDLHLNSTQVQCAALSPTCSHLLTAHLDHTIRLWDLSTGKEIRRLDGHVAEIQALTFSPDGKRALSGAGQVEAGRPIDCTMRLWDLATGSQLQSFAEHQRPVSAVAFSPDGARAASGAADKLVRIYGLPR